MDLFAASTFSDTPEISFLISDNVGSILSTSVSTIILWVSSTKAKSFAFDKTHLIIFTPTEEGEYETSFSIFEDKYLLLYVVPSVDSEIRKYPL